MTRKKRSQIFCAGVEQQEKGCSSLRHKAEVKGRLGFVSKLETWLWVDGIWTPARDDIERDKNYDPYYLVNSEKDYHTRYAAVKTKPANKYVIIKTENQEAISRSESLSLSIYFSIYLW